MPIQSRYLFIASMDVDPQRQSLFNEVYNTEHCPLLSQVPGSDCQSPASSCSL